MNLTHLYCFSATNRLSIIGKLSKLFYIVLSHHSVYIIFELVPSHAPRLLQVSAKTSNSVFVQWEPIPKHHVQGKLLGYHVHYSQEDTSYPVIKNVITVNGSVTHATLDNLKPLTRYRVWITGFTGKGAGPNSEKEFVSTPPAGKFIHL